MEDDIDWTGCTCIESVPGRLGGVPVLLGKRMQPDAVLENFEDGLSVEACYHFFLDEDAVRGVLGFAGRLQAAHAA